MVYSLYYVECLRQYVYAFLGSSADKLEVSRVCPCKQPGLIGQVGWKMRGGIDLPSVCRFRTLSGQTTTTTGHSALPSGMSLGRQSRILSLSSDSICQQTIYTTEDPFLMKLCEQQGCWDYSTAALLYLLKLRVSPSFLNSQERQNKD